MFGLLSTFHFSLFKWRSGVESPTSLAPSLALDALASSFIAATSALKRATGSGMPDCSSSWT